MIEKRIQFGIRNVGQNLWLPSSEEVFGAEFDPLEAWFRADVVSSLITSIASPNSVAMMSPLLGP